MKVITISEKNMKSVCGRLRKFFYNKNHTGFEEWHNFDCGFKKHISPLIYIGKDKIRNVLKYPSPDAVEYNPKGTVLGIGYSYILLRLTASDGDSLRTGDKIAFCGNRIIYRTKCSWGKHKYIYTVFQVLPMEERKQNQIKAWAEQEEAMYEADYYADYYGM